MAEPDKQQFGDGSDQWANVAQNLTNAAKELGKESAKQAASAGTAAATAHSSAAFVKAGVEGGKAISEIAAGTAAGGPWGAVLSAAWSLRHTLYKLLVCTCLVLLIFIILLTSLPSIVTNQVFGLNGADMTSPLTLSQSMTSLSGVVAEAMEAAHQAALEQVNDRIAEGGYDPELSLEALDDQAGDSSYDAAYVLCAYSVSMEQLGTSEADLRAKLAGLELFPVTYEVKTTEIEVEQEVSSEGGSSSSTQTETVSYLVATIHPLNQDAILEAFQLDPEAPYGEFSITCGEAVSNMAAALKLTLYGSALGMVGGSVGSRRGNEEVAAIALSQVGQVGGYPYWSWYGFSSRVEWCACFVSWCYAQAGLSEPRFSGCTSGGDGLVPIPRPMGREGLRGHCPRGCHFLQLVRVQHRRGRPCGYRGGGGRKPCLHRGGKLRQRCLQLQKLPPGQLGDPRLRSDAVAIKGMLYQHSFVSCQKFY